MIKKILFSVILITLLLAQAAELSAQSSINNEETITFDRESLPQWAKDLRRFDIVAFGIFPIAVIFTDLIYNNQFKITNNYYFDVVLISAGVSLTLAAIDLIIVLANRNKEKRKLERSPAGSYEIEVVPYDNEPPDESQPDADNNELN